MPAPTEIELLQSQFKELTSSVSTMKKDFELKLETAQKDAKEYKDLAYKREDELRKYKEESEKAAREKEAALAVAQATDIAQFVESKVKAGIIAPARKEAVTAFMKSLTSDTNVIEFSEKDGSKRSHSQLSLFKDLISSMKPVVPMNHEFTVQPGIVEEVEENGESIEKFMEVIEEGVKKKFPIKEEDLHNKAVDYQEQQRKLGFNVEYYDALIKVSPKNHRATSKA